MLAGVVAHLSDKDYTEARWRSGNTFHATHAARKTGLAAELAKVVTQQKIMKLCLRGFRMRLRDAA